MKDVLKILQNLVDSSTVTIKELNDYIVYIGTQFAVQNRRMPRGGKGWAYGKPMDSYESLGFVAKFAEKHRIKDERLITVMELAAFTADIGRMIVEVERAAGNLVPEQRFHGLESAKLLAADPGFMKLAHDPLHVALFEAIQYHSDAKTPPRDTFASEGAYRLCQLLRDLDKVSVWVGKGMKYVLVRTETADQIRNNKLVDLGFITPSVLETFEGTEMIIRVEGMDLLDWLLQFLRWRQDFNFPEFWELVRASGAPSVVLGYIHGRLTASERRDQWLRVKAAAIAHDMVTAEDIAELE